MPSQIPPVIRALLIANVAIYLLQQLAGDFLTFNFALWPFGEKTGIAPDGSVVTVGFQLWQLLSYGFLHSGLAHLAMNMLGLYMLGGHIEQVLGPRHFLIYYLTCIVGAALAQLLVVEFFLGGFYPTVGASGGVFGVLLAFALLFPRERLILFPIPLPIPAWLFVTLYASAELYFGVTGTLAGIAHFAHLGGMVIGFVLLQYWRGKLPLKPRRQLRL
ncbi:rhomboid family intramembrane serine protease [Tahibacter harae]|uniref:Rhomboid family intramembrane serine protease n=1 Tax=Tahibacter harae TaxID=2963937 RepID=A0ABT1QLN4_9GAMM|nr:rhomboid family intramembrane serine protease [Tahibacter harae]MCQ4163433.1 rhomboid family intramembrane serine protease [Tahibacter harae]